jgi:NIPSNAP
MAVAQVAMWRPRPGRYEDFLKVCNQARKIHQRLGAQVRIWQSQLGSNANMIVYVAQHVDGTAFGQFIDKVNADGEWQQLVSSFVKDPPAEQEQSNLLQELP